MSGYLAPVAAGISSSWDGHRRRTPSSSEPGTDYASAYGATVVAAGDGRVVDVKLSTTTATGRFVTIDLDDGRRVRYLHLSGVLVKIGDRVSRGQAIARSGASGFGKQWHYGPHVHVTLWATHAYSFGKNATLDFELYVGSPTSQEDEMKVFVINGNYYAIGKQYLSHLESGAQVAEAEALYGSARNLGNGDAASEAGARLIAQLDLHGVPQGVLDGVGRVLNPQSDAATADARFEANGTWSREREILAAL